MAEIAIESAPQKVRDLFNRGFSALERGNLDYAIDLLSSCLEIEPAALRARKFLRKAELQKRKASPPSSLNAAMISAKALPQTVMIGVLIKQKKADQALSTADKLLRLDPLNSSFLLLFADAAMLRELPEAAIMTLEAAREFKPDDIPIMKRLAELYVAVDDTKSARDILEKLANLRPNDPAFVKAHKDAMAMHSMARDGWQQASAKGGSFRDVMRNTDEATRLEREAKSVKSDDDADSLIEDMLRKIQAEPENMTCFRQLARLYVQKQQFEDAIATLEEALQRTPGDPELDQMLSVVRMQQMDVEIRQLREAGDEEGAHNREIEKAQYVQSDLEERVRRYPNDLRIRFEYGVALFDAERINDAIQQFQSAQRSPKHRTRSLYYLALCFKQKSQYDMAAQQLNAAAADLIAMDATKKDILYELGSLYELMGDAPHALKYFKEIYQVDIGYRDVAAKVEQQYSGN